MSKFITTELLDRYLKGQCDAEEIEQVHHWINLYSNDDDYISSVDEATRTELKNKMLAIILEKIDQENKADSNIYDIDTYSRKDDNVKSLFLRLGTIAAAVILVIGSFFLFKLYKPHNVGNNQEVASSLSFMNKTKALYKLTLPDKSIAWLSPNATINYPKQFARDYRLVKMNGECFFEVTKGAKWPFVIQSAHIITKVWGTSFRVRDFAGTNSSDVSVVTGKVSVSPNRGSLANINKLHPGEVMLLPHEQGTLKTGMEAVAKQQDTNDAALSIWNKANLSFEQTTFKKMIPVIEKQFNVEIKVKDPAILDEVLNADLNNFNLPDILLVFEKTLNIKYTMEDHVVTLSR